MSSTISSMAVNSGLMASSAALVLRSHELWQLAQVSTMFCTWHGQVRRCWSQQHAWQHLACVPYGVLSGRHIRVMAAWSSMHAPHGDSREHSMA